MKQLTRPARLYEAKTDPQIVDVPPMQFVMVDGKGDPNSATEFQQAIQALFGAAYGLKFMLKKERGMRYPGSPLEALWWTPGSPKFPAGSKDAWRWTAMIMVPVEVTAADFERIRGELRRKRPSPAVEKLRLERFHEGPSAQVMHVGPYATEAPTIERLHLFIHDHGYTFDARKQKHHEIYLGDPRRAKPEKLRTMIRQAFVRKP